MRRRERCVAVGRVYVMVEKRERVVLGMVVGLLCKAWLPTRARLKNWRGSVSAWHVDRSLRG